MGLLDDAIREHLDLKRRRGADPAEVARMEQEALGPVRREPVPAEAADEHHDEHHEPAELGGAAAPAASEPTAHEPEHEPAREPEPEHAADADRAGGDEDARPAAEGRTGAHPESTGPARQAAEPEHEGPDHDDPVLQPTTEFRVEDEDVLEETPEFLQETPEHDRLWFEQRPPRDFDFDG